jgi:cytochrome d ubiquinol oxidase subunit I
MLSLLVNGDANEPVDGLDKLEPTWGKPPVWITFQAYHAMVGIGVLFFGATVVSCFYWWRGTLFEQRWLLRFYVFAVLLAFAANELGWVAAEVGRQPWIVYPTLEDGQLVGGLRTSEGLSESVRASQVLASIIMFGLVYLLLFALWIFLLNKKIQEGPESLATTPDTDEGGILEAATRRGVVRKDMADS